MHVFRNGTSSSTRGGVGLSVEALSLLLCICSINCVIKDKILGSGRWSSSKLRGMKKLHVAWEICDSQNVEALCMWERKSHRPMWLITSINTLTESKSAFTSHLCAVSIIPNFHKRARHRSLNISVTQSSCGFHWLAVDIRWPLRDSFWFSTHRMSFKPLYAGCC
jgi:hypothetical protein